MGARGGTRKAHGARCRRDLELIQGTVRGVNYISRSLFVFTRRIWVFILSAPWSFRDLSSGEVLP